MIDPNLLPFAEILQRLEAGAPFSFTRWGDGEWIAALGRRVGGANCDGVRYTEHLASELGWALERLRAFPEHVFGLQRLGLRLFPRDIERLAPDVVWAAADVFHDASLAGRIPRLLQALRDGPGRVFLLGPPHLALLAERFGFTAAPVHATDAHPRQAHLFAKTVEAAPSGAVIGLSTGIGANIWTAQGLCLRRDVSIIDFGSVWDPYCGVKSRRYMRNDACDFSLPS